MMRVSIVHPIPSPYREKLFTELSSLENVTLKVYYCGRKMSGYDDWQFSYGSYQREFLPGREFGRRIFFNPAIVNRLLAERPDTLVIWGWSSPTMQMALLAARILSIPTFIYAPSALPFYQARNQISARLIHGFKWFLLRIPQAFLVPGKLAMQYLLSYGVKAEQIYMVPINCVDTKLLNCQAQLAHRDTDQIKRKLGIQAKHSILYVGRLVPGKGLSILLNAYEDLRRRLSDIALVIVGGGSQRDSLESEVVRRKVPDVHIVGPQPYEALPKYYGISDCLVLPTLSDQWPLVVLEAMSSGLPVVTTTRCGNVPDLIDGRSTGLVVEPGNVSELSQAVQDVLLMPPAVREAVRQQALAVAADYDYRVAASKFAQVLNLELYRSNSSH
jgi:glycosyltransferase involved in cell wall biosynthesis